MAKESIYQGNGNLHGAIPSIQIQAKIPLREILELCIKSKICQIYYLPQLCLYKSRQ